MWEDGGFRGLERTKYFLGCFWIFLKNKNFEETGLF